MAIPDPSRGERVNVGIVIFLPCGPDVRLAEISKIRALTGHDWTEYAQAFQQRFSARFAITEDPQDVISGFHRIDPVFRSSELAWFSINSEDDYESRVREILGSLVLRPRPDDWRIKSTRINTEIALILKKFKLLTTKDESIDSHNVVRNHFIEDELNADFAQQNGVMRVAATLDLRRNADLNKATLKAIVLARAKAKYPADTERIGIYAATAMDDPHVKMRIGLLDDYSTKIVNWQDPPERQWLINVMRAGSGVRGGPLFG